MMQMEIKDLYVPVLTGVVVVGAASVLLLRLTGRKRNKFADLDLEGRDLTGKTAVVTGANTGIGFWTAQDLAARHARVILACRSLERGGQARDKIVAATGNNDVHVSHLDLSDFTSVRQFAEHILQSEGHLDILVNNAGVYVGNLPDSDTRTDSGVDYTMTVNHLGPYLLTRLLIGLLRSSAPSRIINVSSEAQSLVRGSFDFEGMQGTKTLSAFSAYAHSKLGNLLFTRSLAQKLEQSGVKIYCVHPGVVSTEIWRNLPLVIRKLIPVIFFFRMTEPQVGAQTTIYTCVADDSNLESGKYYVDCSLAENKVNSLSNDKNLAQKLWEVSARLTGLSPELDL